MEIAGKLVLLTGATGGIGSELAKRLADRGARLILSSLRQEELDALAGQLPTGSVTASVAADLTHSEDRKRLVKATDGMDLAILNAGGLLFDAFENSAPSRIESLIETNLTAPMMLTHALLPRMKEYGSGRIVLTGSILGSIGMPYYAAYSASKAGLQRFVEAMRRELGDSPIDISLVAPRATDTGLNDQRAREMHKRTGTHVDSPAVVADAILDAIERDRPETNIGWPERLFVRLNALFPSLVDRALIKQGRIMREFID